MALHLTIALLIIFAYFLLMIQFVYTLIAIFRGSAYIPTPQKRVDHLVRISGLKPTDTVLDFGSGDGRILAAFCKAGAKKCIGIEINPLLVAYSRLRFFLSGKKNVYIHLKNIWTFDISEVDILASYMTACFADKLGKKIIAEMRPGATVVSYRFEIAELTLIRKEDNVFLYQVPAKTNK